MMTRTIIMASGDPRVVILITNGFRVHIKWVGQNGDPEARRRGVTSKDIRMRVILPRRSCITAEDRRSGSKGVYRNVALSYGLSCMSSYSTRSRSPNCKICIWDGSLAYW